MVKTKFSLGVISFIYIVESSNFKSSAVIVADGTRLRKIPWRKRINFGLTSTSSSLFSGAGSGFHRVVIRGKGLASTVEGFALK